jgi:hypothetical protein
MADRFERPVRRAPNVQLTVPDQAGGELWKMDRLGQDKHPQTDNWGEASRFRTLNPKSLKHQLRKSSRSR